MTARNGPPWKERRAVQLQQYNFDVAHCPGVNNPGDYLLRHPIAADPRTQQETDNGVERLIKLITELACPQVLFLEEILEPTKEDCCIQKAKEALKGHQWKNFLDGVDGLTDEKREARMGM